MKVVKYYKIYTTTNLLGSKNALVLEPVEFGRKSRFDTEEEAIEALVTENKTYQDFVIIKQVFIRS